jgi:hypothetical protein
LAWLWVKAAAAMMGGDDASAGMSKHFAHEVNAGAEELGGRRLSADLSSR